jgi:hypothetical protein
MLVLCLVIPARKVHARANIRSAFFESYPGAVGTEIETVPSQPGHCGVCHYDFTGSGPKNPYGVRLAEVLPDFKNNPNGRKAAVQSIENEDPDSDGFNTLTEVTELATFYNTPTFPGLTPANVTQVINVTVTDIQQHLVPSTGVDINEPNVVLLSPNGGETLTANTAFTIEWTATDAEGSIAGVYLYVSLDNGSPYTPIALGISNTGSHKWYPGNRPTTQALIRIEALDNAFNKGSDSSDSVFTIEAPPGGAAPTTLRDFDQPGSQPFEAGLLNPPAACAVCHGDYDPTVEPFYNWKGSMMSQASIDPIFLANMAIANQDAPDSGDLCLRCHLPRGWLQGRSVPTDGSQMQELDKSGVSCDFCHRLVDPFSDPVHNPAEDADILAGLSNPPANVGNGMYIVDPDGGARRGPFVDATGGHGILVSPFHREAALCGTCHDVSNSAFEKDNDGNYVPNIFDSAATDFSPSKLLPVERTYSEWFYSAYNSPTGIYAPQFGGNKDYVATCQDCHMKDVTGQGCNLSPPIRSDLPLHDMTGGSTWLPEHLSIIDPNVDVAALQSGIDRARNMIQNAADVNFLIVDSNLIVTITNNCGHKLPTGYPEGRRMWINVQFYDKDSNLLTESGAYDANSGVLSHDDEAKIYEVKPGLDDLTGPLVGEPSGPSFHFVLNNKVYKDNRIPPRGFTNTAFDGFGGSPVKYSYQDGQYWDNTSYAIPAGATSAKVTFYYQSTSKEFVEFLLDKNTTNSKGQEMFDLWNDNGKCPPEEVKTTSMTRADFTQNGRVNFIDYALIASYFSQTCTTDQCKKLNLADSNQVIDANDINIFFDNWLW